MADFTTPTTGEVDAVCLFSGGLDSTVALALAREQGWRVLALTIDYGQRAASRETVAARALSQHLGAAHRLLRIPLFDGGVGGALLESGQELPHPDEQQLDDPEAAASTAAAVWVPNRNGVLVEVAAAVAESLGASRVVVGFNREEAATFPDNSEEYLAALNAALAFSTQGRVTVVSPTARMDKVEIAREVVRLGLPREAIWPCYGAAAEICGECESCRRFVRAFRAVGEADGDR